jgi:DNA-binding transcriptional LysR family regulator
MIEKISLNSFKFFYYVALYNSVTIAAERLFVTQGAVSKQIKNLEEVLQFKLFNRKSKNISLTNRGLVLFNCCQDTFHKLDLCLLSLQNNTIQQKTSLVLSCEPTFCMKWLMPKLNKFDDLDLDFDIKILTQDGIPDFKADNIDIAIHRKSAAFPKNLYTYKLVDEIMFFTKTPTLNRSNIVISTSRSKLWNDLLNRKETKELILNYKKFEFEYFYLCIEAALSGNATTIVSGFMIENELKTNTLIPIIPPFYDDSSYYLVSQESIEEDPKKIIFKEWLSSELSLSSESLKKQLPLN